MLDEEYDVSAPMSSAGQLFRRARSRRPCMRACAGLVIVQVLLFTACGRQPSAEIGDLSNGAADIDLPRPIGPAEQATKCHSQGARFVAGGLWGNRATKRLSDALLKWEAHYSVKNEECSVLIEHRLRAADGFEVVYSELWEPFGATPLAAWTDDPRSDVRRDICRIEISDHPLVSCRVARYFIDDHIRH